MASPHDRPPLSRDNISPHDALCHALGEYVIKFALADHSVTIIGAQLLKITLNQAGYIWRDAGLKAKMGVARRAVREQHGKESIEARNLNSVFNRLDNCAKFRNDLMHGMFVNGNRHGKPGESLTELWQGLEPLTHSKVAGETHKLGKVVRCLFELSSSGCQRIVSPYFPE